MNNSIADIRFAAHGSPYYAPERMEGIVAKEKIEIEKEIGIYRFALNKILIII